jgi:flagellin
VPINDVSLSSFPSVVIPMLSLFTNLASNSAQIALLKTQKSMQKSMQRLSSGLRINDASDDPAGLAIATSMDAKVASSLQGIRNANDGISMAQTIDGALSSVTDVLTRIRELAVQAATGTLSEKDREAIQTEYDQLSNEITNIKANTKFNGIYPLSSDTPSTSLQVGPDPGDTISMPLLPKDLELRTDGFGGSFIDTSELTADMNSYNSNKISFQVNDSTVNINTVDDGVSYNFGYGSALAIKNAVDAQHIQNMQVGTYTSVYFGLVTNSPPSYSGPIDLTIDGIQVDNVTWDPSSGIQLGQAIANQISSQLGSKGITANYTWNYTDINNVVHTTYGLAIQASNGQNIEIGTTGNTSNVISFDAMSLNDGVAKDKTAIGYDYFDDEWPVGHPLSITHGLSIADGQGQNVPTGPFAAPVASSGVMLDQNTARDFIANVDAQIQNFTAYRSQVAAIQNQLGSAISNQQTSVQNQTAARSIISDADIAAETANLTRCQILQQASVAVLVQANSSQNLALDLLKNV